MKKFAQGFIRLVDAVNEKMKYVGLLYIPMAVVMGIEVIARYVFNHPTKWAWDVNSQLQVITAVMAGGYCLLNHGHVRMDIFYGNFSKKKKALTDVATCFLHFLFLGVLTYQLIDIAISSVAHREFDNGLLRAPLYPLRVLMAVGGALFLLQALAELFKNIIILATKEKAVPAADQ